MQANLVITNQTQAGKKITTTISYINPDAYNSKLKALAIALTNLTKNEYISASKATKNEDVEKADPTPESGKLEPTLTVSNDGTGYVEYNGDGKLYCEFDPSDNNGKTLLTTVIARSDGTATQYRVLYTDDNLDPEYHYKGTLYASEGETYAAKSVSITLWSM